MEVHLTPEQEAKLGDIASRTGRQTREVVQAAVDRLLDEESVFIEAIERGFASLDRGEYVEHEEVGDRLQRLLRS